MGDRSIESSRSSGEREKPLRRIVALVLIAAAIVAVAFSRAGRAAAGQAPGGPQADRVDVLIAFQAIPGPADQALVRRVGGRLTYTYHLVPAIAASIPLEAVPALRADPRVAAIEPDGPVFAVHHDAELGNTWGVRRIGAGEVHDAGNVGSGVAVAVIDSGIDYTHPELGPSFGGGWDFVNNDPDPWDDHGHGTHMAGTIAAALDGVGVVGGAPLVRLYALKVLSARGVGSWSHVIAALQWAVDNRIQVTNNSYVGGTPLNASTVQAAFEHAEAAGVLHVAAAGNSGTCEGTTNSLAWPAALSAVIAVGATDVDDTRPCFSSTGPDLELVAPGVGINSTVRNGGYGTFSGTSTASPHVAAASALVIAAGVADWNGNGRANDEVRGILAATARDLGAPGRDPHYGFGLVDAAATFATTAANAAPLAVAITSPADGETVSGPITLTATASGTFIGIQFFVDDWATGPEGTTSPYSVGWDTATVSNGSHRIDVVGRDGADNRVSAAVTVTVANGTLPTISSFSPASGAVGTSVTISGTNFTGATAVTFNGVSASFTVGSSTSITATVPSGATTGPIGVTTPGGTASSASAFTVGTTLAVAITSPANGETVSGPITLTATASGAFIGIQFFVDDRATGAEGTTSPYSVSWNTTTVSNGSHRIDVVARDAADNRVSAAVTVTVAN